MNESDLDKMEVLGNALLCAAWSLEAEAQTDTQLFIAMCNPPTILAMINDIRNLRKELAKKNTELFHAERVTGCQAHEMGSVGPCTCRREMGG